MSSFIEYLALFRDNYQLEFEIAGILPVMFKNNGKIDNMIIQSSIDKYGEHVFKIMFLNEKELNFGFHFTCYVRMTVLLQSKKYS